MKIDKYVDEPVTDEDVIEWYQESASEIRAAPIKNSAWIIMQGRILKLSSTIAKGRGLEVESDS